MTTLDQLKAAKAACPALLRATTEQKNQALSAMADALLHHEVIVDEQLTLTGLALIWQTNQR